MPEKFRAAYRQLGQQTLAERAAAAREMLLCCELCPRRCRVNRRQGELGFCRTGGEAVVASYGPHFGEESPLVGRGGSGTIFLSRCNLDCIFCQNYDISHQGYGETVSPARLAGIMFSLQRRGCPNINWVTPTHQMPQLLAALVLASEQGLEAPIVYNCGGYESLEALRILDGVVDIYMPDAKYGDNAAGQRLSGVPDYWERNQAALAEMHRQVGDLILDEAGVAQRGLLIRHLVLPDNLAATREAMAFIASLSPKSYVNVMAQYRPAFRAAEVREINRPLSGEEYRQAVTWAREVGLRRLDRIDY
jgi:putative pyruvate formate lyase activating enzyme